MMPNLKNMQKFIKISITILTFLLIINIVNKVVHGKTETAPGQNKVQEKSTKRVFIGSLENIGTSSITIGDKKENKKTEAEIDENTKIFGQDKKELKIGTLKLKELIALISTDSGNMSSSGAKLKIQKVFVKQASESAQSKRKAVQGVIIDISGNTITVAHQIQRERTYTVLITSETYIQTKSSESSNSATLSASGSASVNLTSLQVGQRIVAVGDLNETGGIIAKRIHIIPGKASGIFKKLPVSTPSASLIASPSAVATVSASVLPSFAPSPSVVVTATPGL